MGKLRTSVGIRADGYIGAGDRVIPHSSAEVEFAAMSENTTMTYMLAYDSALKDEERVYLQLAVLYTTLDGQRLVRVHNMCLTATTDHKVNAHTTVNTVFEMSQSLICFLYVDCI